MYATRAYTGEAKGNWHFQRPRVCVCVIYRKRIEDDDKKTAHRIHIQMHARPSYWKILTWALTKKKLYFSFFFRPFLLCRAFSYFFCSHVVNLHVIMYARLDDDDATRRVLLARRPCVLVWENLPDGCVCVFMEKRAKTRIPVLYSNNTCHKRPILSAALARGKFSTKVLFFTKVVLILIWDPLWVCGGIGKATHTGKCRS